MAVLWERKTNQTHYQVKQAGNSIRLYSNGVFHSQWNDKNPVIGQLWESLFLPALFLNSEKPLKVLLLGVGGGAVVNLLNHFLDIESVTGIELDPIHLKVAKRWFKSEGPNVIYCEAEAVSWLTAYKGPKFDLIIDDLFISDSDGEVLRAVPANEEWLSMLTKNLCKVGVLAMNFESIRQAKSCWRKSARAVGMKSAGIFTSKRNENAIGVFSPHELRVRDFMKRLKSFPELDITKTNCKLDFSYRKLRS